MNEKMKTYTILRPPTHLKSYAMPTKLELENLKANDIVKVVFADIHGNNGERMWNKIINIDKHGNIVATLSNSPVGIDLKYGAIVEFHVTDIIDINAENLEEDWLKGKIEDLR